MMVLSASSVNAYVNYDDSYFYVKRQVVFLVVGVIGAVVIMKLPSSTLRMLGWFGLGAGRGVVDLDLHPARHHGERQPQLALPRLVAVRDPARRVRQAGHRSSGGRDILARKQRLLDRPKHLLVPFLPVTGLLILLVALPG